MRRSVEFYPMYFIYTLIILYNAFTACCGGLQSSLLQCILGELKPLKGSVEVNGRVSYASQTPWVFSGTVKENILFGAPLDVERYDKVVDACALRQVSPWRSVVHKHDECGPCVSSCTYTVQR